MKYRDPITGNFKEIYIKVSDTLPVGSICQYGGITAPVGYLICNGSAVSRTDYSELFSAIGTTFGSGDGLTTFNLPNFKGRVPVGLDGTQTEFDVLGETGGNKIHSHNLNGTGFAKIGISQYNTLVNETANVTSYYNGYGVVQKTVQEGGTDVATNLMGSTNTEISLQPYLVTNFIIKAANRVSLDRGNVINVESNSTEDAYSCDYVNNQAKWKYLGTGTNTDRSISLSGEYNELLIIFTANHPSNYVIGASLILQGTLVNTLTDYVYFDTGGQYFVFRVGIKSDTATLNLADVDTTSVLSSTSMRVYYR